MNHLLRNVGPWLLVATVAGLGLALPVAMLVLGVRP